MDKGLGQGEGLTWPLDISALLLEEVDPSAVFPLRALDANIVRWHPGPMDASVCGPHQSDSKPTLDVSAHPRVGLTTLCCKATGHPYRVSVASTPIIQLAKATKGEKCRRCWRHDSK